MTDTFIRASFRMQQLLQSKENEINGLRTKFALPRQVLIEERGECSRRIFDEVLQVRPEQPQLVCVRARDRGF